MQKVVRDLLARAESTHSEHEAKEAILKAHELIAKYNVVLDNNQMPEEIIFKACKHPDNAGFREYLASIIADNFRVKGFMPKGTIGFLGHRSDVMVAKEVFEYTYRFANLKSRRIVDDLRRRYIDTTGVKQSYVIGFCQGLQEKLEAQSKLLAVVLPKDVEEKYQEILSRKKPDDTNKKKHRRTTMRIKHYSPSYHDLGKKDGRESLEQRDRDMNKAG